MYKIYINDTPLFLVNQQDLTKRPLADDTVVTARYMGKSKQLLNYIDMMEKSSRFSAVWIFAKDVEQLFEDFSSLYKVVEAAGGLVYNDQEELLMIYRRGSWDLPKGKIDKGETKEAAAVREVAEETGLDEVQLGDLLKTSYHTYRNRKNRRVLKPTYWYKMRTRQTQLKLQAEEDIEAGEWITAESFLQSERPVYGNIKDLLLQAINTI
ncbi:MAG: NUDIX domain-containing protein [Bacteroidota bacterium]